MAIDESQSKAETKQFLYDLHVDDIRQKQHMMRSVEAIGYGLNPAEYSRPFPGTNTFQTVATQTSGRLWPVAATLLATLAGGGLVGTAAGLMGAFSNDKPAAVQPAEPEGPPPREFKVEFLDKDGNPITIEEK